MDGNLEWISPGSPPPTSPPNAGPVPGEPEPGPRRGRGRTIRTVAIATVTAGVLALIGVSVASAQSSGPTTTKPATTPSTTAPSGTTPKPGPRKGPGGFIRGGPGFPGPGGPGGFGAFGAAGSIHGEFTRRNGTGYQTVDTQVGTVQTVSTTSITVVSADGFTQSYKVSANTVVNSGQLGINSVKAKDTVQVEAVVTGSGAALVREAESIIDTTSLGGIRGHWNPPKPATPPTTTG